MANWYDDESALPTEVPSTITPALPENPLMQAYQQGLSGVGLSALQDLPTYSGTPGVRQGLSQYGTPTGKTPEEYAASLPPVQTAVSQEDKPLFDLSNTASALWDAGKSLGTTLPSAYYQMKEGLKRPDEYSPEAVAAFAAQKELEQKNNEAIQQQIAAGNTDSTSESIREAIPSIGFSGVSMGAAIPAALAGGALTQAAVPIPGSGIVGGIAASMGASGTAAFRMMGNQVLNDIFQTAEAESQKKQQRSLNEEEKAKLYADMLPIAENSALWEAGPEAVGNALTMVGGGIALKLLGKSALSKITGNAFKKAGIRAAAAGTAVGGELATETVTEYNQGNNQAKIDAYLAGQPIDSALPAYQGLSGAVEAFKKVAPPTLALLGMFGLVGGAVKTGSKIHERFVQNPRDAETLVGLAEDPNVLSAMPEQSLDNLAVLGQWLQKKTKNENLANAIGNINAEITSRKEESPDIQAERQKVLGELWQSMEPKQQAGILSFLGNDSPGLTGWVDREGAATGDIDLQGLQKLRPVLEQGGAAFGVNRDLMTEQQRIADEVRTQEQAKQQATQQAEAARNTSVGGLPSLNDIQTLDPIQFDALRQPLTPEAIDAQTPEWQDRFDRRLDTLDDEVTATRKHAQVIGEAPETLAQAATARQAARTDTPISYLDALNETVVEKQRSLLNNEIAEIDQQINESTQLRGLSAPDIEPLRQRKAKAYGQLLQLQDSINGKPTKPLDSLIVTPKTPTETAPSFTPTPSTIEQRLQTFVSTPEEKALRTEEDAQLSIWQQIKPTTPQEKAVVQRAMQTIITQRNQREQDFLATQQIGQQAGLQSQAQQEEGRLATLQGLQMSAPTAADQQNIDTEIAALENRQQALSGLNAANAPLMATPNSGQPVNPQSQQQALSGLNDANAPSIAPAPAVSTLTNPLTGKTTTLDTSGASRTLGLLRRAAQVSAQRVAQITAARTPPAAPKVAPAPIHPQVMTPVQIHTAHATHPFLPWEHSLPIWNRIARIVGEPELTESLHTQTVETAKKQGKKTVTPSAQKAASSTATPTASAAETPTTSPTKDAKIEVPKTAKDRLSNYELIIPTEDGKGASPKSMTPPWMHEVVQEFEQQNPQLKEATKGNLVKDDLSAANGIPTFQGGKRKVAQVAFPYFRYQLRGVIPSITTIHDYFGGSGGWGLAVAARVAINTQEIHLYELNEDRSKKIQMFAGVNPDGSVNQNRITADRFIEIAGHIRNTEPQVTQLLNDMAVKSQAAGRDEKGSVRLLSQATLARNLSGILDSIPASQDELRAVLQAIIDQGNKQTPNRIQAGEDYSAKVNILYDNAVRVISNNINGIQNNIEQIKKTRPNFKIIVHTGDSFQVTQQTGAHVLAIYDPPYYGTNSYNGQDLVPIETYRQVRDALARAKAAGNHIIYTDAPWWGHKELPNDMAMGEAHRIYQDIQTITPLVILPVGERYEILGVYANEDGAAKLNPARTQPSSTPRPAAAPATPGATGKPDTGASGQPNPPPSSGVGSGTPASRPPSAPVVEPPNPETDDLLLAISKLGGLDSEIINQEHIDLNGNKNLLLGNIDGKMRYVFSEFGLSLDGMAEALSQDNYPVFNDPDNRLEYTYQIGETNRYNANAMLAALRQALTDYAPKNRGGGKRIYAAVAQARNAEQDRENQYQEKLAQALDEHLQQPVRHYNAEVEGRKWRWEIRPYDPLTKTNAAALTEAQIGFWQLFGTQQADPKAELRRLGTPTKDIKSIYEQIRKNAKDASVNTNDDLFAESFQEPTPASNDKVIPESDKITLTYYEESIENNESFIAEDLERLKSQLSPAAQDALKYYTLETVTFPDGETLLMAQPPQENAVPDAEADEVLETENLPNADDILNPPPKEAKAPKPTESPKATPKDVAPTLAETDLNAMFDDLLNQEVAKDQDEKQPKPAPTPEPQPTAGQVAASAIRETAKGLSDTLDALAELFGGNGRLSMNPTFDEETYAKAKPLFQSAIAHFKNAAEDIREAMRLVIRALLDRFKDPEMVKRMQPYVVRFIEDMQAETVVPPATKPTSAPATEAVVAPKTVAEILKERGVETTINRQWEWAFSVGDAVLVTLPETNETIPILVNSELAPWNQPRHFDKETGFYFRPRFDKKTYAFGPFKNKTTAFVEAIFHKYLKSDPFSVPIQSQIKKIANRMVTDVEYRQQAIQEGLAYAIAQNLGIPVSRGTIFTETGATGTRRASSNAVLDQLRGRIRTLARGDTGSGDRVSMGTESPRTKDYRSQVSQDTVGLIERGLEFMPRQVVDWQIEDIGKALANYEKKPAFMLSSDPGSGKTFVIGGLIKEILARSPDARVLYFTNSNALIDQVRQQDLPDYGINDPRVDIITYARIQNPRNARVTHYKSHSTIEFGGEDEQRIVVNKDTVLIFDEAHKVKNIIDGSEGANNAGELMRRAKFTFYSSATPFETPSESEYLANSGLFSDYDELAKRENILYKDLPLNGFQIWAIEHGADIQLTKDRKKRNAEPRLTIKWPASPTFIADPKLSQEERLASIRLFEAAQLEFMIEQLEAGQKARQWFVDRNLMSHRPIELGSLPDGREASITHLTPVAIDAEFYEKYYNPIIGVFDAAMADPSEEAAPIKDMIKMQRENTKKRLAEFGKLAPTARMIEQDLQANPANKAVVFLSAKAPLELGTFGIWNDVTDDTGEKRIIAKINAAINGERSDILSAVANEKFKGDKPQAIGALKYLINQIRNKQFTIDDMLELENKWKSTLGAMVEVTKFSPDGMPYQIIENQGLFSAYSRYMAQAFKNADMVTRLESPVKTMMELLEPVFGKGSVAEYTGALTAQKNTTNRESWKQANTGPRILIATMAKGGTGLSLHDTTGNRPSFQYNVAIPYKASEFEQVSGRIARYGLKSQANVHWLFANNMPDDFDFRWAKILQERLNNQQAVVKGAITDTTRRLTADNILGQRAQASRTKATAPGLSKSGFVAAIRERFPHLSGALDKILARGEKGQKGGLVLINSKEVDDIARVFAEKTGRQQDDAIQEIRGNGRLVGIFDPRSGLTFAVLPNLSTEAAPSVLLHEMIHGQQQADVDAAAMKLVKNPAQEKNPALRQFLNRVYARLEAAGATNDPKEYTAYLVEEAVSQGRLADFQVADGKFIEWVAKTISPKIADFLRRLVNTMRGWFIQRGYPINASKLTLEDLVNWAQAGVRKAARGDVQIADQAAISRGDQPNPMFYSGLSKVINDLSQKKAPGPQWASILENLVKKGQVKQEELDWTGTLEWLRGQKTLVPKEDVLAFVRSNEIQVEETEFGIPSNRVKYRVDTGFWEIFDENNNYVDGSYHYDALEKRYPELINEYKLSQNRNTKWTLPGGKNQRELVITNPNIEPYTTDETHYGDIADGRAIAWVRFNDRTDENGKQVLFIEEIQSKRHQEGKDRGYILLTTDTTGWTAIDSNPNAPPENKHNYYVTDAEGRSAGREVHYLAYSPEEAIALAAQDANEIADGVPNAPFKQTITGSGQTLSGWAGLVFKRMLRYATENGYDKVAWTTGEQQSKRYKGGGDKFLKRLYNETIPNEINKYIKKWGTQVGQTKINTVNAIESVHSIDITPDMVASVMQGQPLFSRAAMNAAKKASVTIGGNRVTAYRKVSSPATGAIQAGTFYFLDADAQPDMVENTFTFQPNELLVVPESEVEAFEGLPSEALASKWFPKTDWLKKVAELELPGDPYQAMGVAMDTLVAQEARQRGYRAIQYGTTELQVLESPVKVYQNNGAWVADAPNGQRLYTGTPAADREWVHLKGEQLFKRWQEEHAYDQQPQVTGYRGVMPEGGPSFGATEGHGVYIAKKKGTASFFSLGKTKKIQYRQPLNPLIVNEEVLPILQEDEVIFQPIESTDSAWIRLNKQAALNIGITDETWGQQSDELTAELTQLILDAGYDAVDVTSGGESWVALLKPELMTASGFEPKPIILPSISSDSLPSIIEPTVNSPQPQIVTTALRLLAQDPALFQNPKATSKNLPEVFQQVVPDFTVRELPKSEALEVDAEQAWEIRVPYTDESGVSETRHGYVMRRKQSVWINVSNLKEGGQGSRFYAAVSDYAANNGLVFIGDPMGLTDIAVYRRTENMLASAIKHGTTKHLWPHEKQGIQWKGNDEADFQSLIEKSNQNILENVPDLKAIRYDFENRRFINTDTGRAFGEDLFTTLAESPGARAAQAGSATLKRTAYLLTLSSRSGEGVGESRRLLADVVQQLREGLTGTPVAGMVYSKSNPQTPAPSGVSASGVEKLIDPHRVAWQRAGLTVNVVQSVSDLSTDLQERLNDPRAEGFYDLRSNQIYLIADNLASLDRAREVLSHEVVGHWSSQNLRDSSEFVQVLNALDRLEKVDNREIRSIAAQVDASQPGLSKLDRASEIFAVTVERGLHEKIGLLLAATNKLLHLIKAVLRRFGLAKDFVNSLTMTDVLQFARESQAKLNQGEEATSRWVFSGKKSVVQSYAGVRATTANQPLLQQAKQRVESGEDAETVRKETGWFKGFDNRWRFEIDDSDFSFNADWIQQQPETLNRIQTQLEQIVSHPQLFSDYPQLQGINVNLTINPNIHDAGGSYGRNDQRINIRAHTYEDAKKTLIHELQHAVQAIEGHSPGASSSLYDEDDLFFKKDYEVIERAKREIELLTKQQKKARTNKTKFARLRDSLPRGSQERANAEEKRKAAVKIENNLTLEISKWGPGGLYKRNFGEIEARDTASRLEMTPEERQATPPYRNTMFRDGIADKDVVLQSNFRTALSVNSDIRYSLPTPQSINDDIGQLILDQQPDPFTMEKLWDKGRDWFNRGLGLMTRQQLVELASRKIPALGRTLLPSAEFFENAASLIDGAKSRIKRDMYDGLVPQWQREAGRNRQTAYLFDYILHGSTLHSIDPTKPLPPREIDDTDYTYAERVRWYGVLTQKIVELKKQSPILADMVQRVFENYQSVNDMKYAAMKERVGRAGYGMVRVTMERAKRMADNHADVAEAAQLQQQWATAALKDKTVVEALYRLFKRGERYSPGISFKISDPVGPIDPSAILKAKNTYQTLSNEQKALYQLRRKIDELPHAARMRELMDRDRATYGKLENLIVSSQRRAINVLVDRVSQKSFVPEEHAAMRAELVQLPEDAQMLYRAMNYAFKARQENMMASIQLYAEAARGRQPYVPLTRYGKYEVFAERMIPQINKRTGQPVLDEAGQPKLEKEVAFSKFETIHEQKQARQLLEKAGWTVNTDYQIIRDKIESAPSGTFVGEMYQFIDESVRNPKERDALKQSLYDLYLENLPDLSVRKHLLRRKGIFGYNRDALRAYGRFMNGSANMIARLRYADVLSEQLYQMEREVTGLSAHENDQAKAGAILNELIKSYDWLMNPTNATWANRLTALGFIWHLTNPSTAMVNLSQLPLMTFPELASKFGGGAAFGAIHKAMYDYSSVLNRWRKMGVNPLKPPMALKASRTVPDANGISQNEVKYSTYTDEAEYQQAIKALEAQGYTIDRAISPLEAAGMEILGGEYQGDMGRLMEFLERSGRVSRSATTQLAGLGEDSWQMRDNWQGKASRLWDLTMKTGAFLFHHSEVANREVTAIAAYRLMREQLKDKPREEAHRIAQDYAYKAIAFTQGDYSNANRARWMRSDMARVLTLFRTYAQIMTWRLLRDAYQSMPMRKGIDPSERAEARARLGWMMLNASLLGGAMGLPIYTMVVLMMKAMEAAFGDDDDPWDFELWANQQLTEMIGERGRQAVMTGPVGMAPMLLGAKDGISLSPRLSLDLIRFWVRKPPSDLEGQELVSEYMKQLAGPAFGLTFKFADAVRDANYARERKSADMGYRAFESLLPSPLANMVKAYRYETEGIKTRRGDQLTNDVGTGQWVSQALGFQPAEVFEAYQENNLLFEFKTERERRAQNLIQGLVYAREARDEEGIAEFRKAIAEFNRKNPLIRITPQRIQNAFKQRRQAHQKSNQGMYIASKGMRKLVENERF